MNLGLLGIDPSTATLAAAALRDGAGVPFASECADDAASSSLLRSLFNGAKAPTAVPWEHLLDSASCDAVLVAAAGWTDSRAEAVRRLVQAGRTLVLSQPLELSMLFAYELDMIRRDSGAALVPMLPDRLHPFVARLRNWIEIRLPSGSVETITLEHGLVDRGRDDVLRAFCRDTDLIRVLAGAPVRLSTLGASDGQTAWSTLAIGLSCPARPPVRWQVVRADAPGLTITVVAADGTVRLVIPEGSFPEGSVEAGAWRWEDSDGTETSPYDRGAVMLGVLDETLAGTIGATDPPAASWDDAARGVEMAETVPRSVAKGRGIDLHQEEFTEIGTFKGTMASLGCGIVLLALAVIVFATLLGGIAKQTGWAFGERLAGLWPIAVLTAMGLFLLLQFLPALVGTAPPPAEPDTRGNPGKP